MRERGGRERLKEGILNNIIFLLCRVRYLFLADLQNLAIPVSTKFNQPGKSIRSKVRTILQ